MTWFLILVALRFTSSTIDEGVEIESIHWGCCVFNDEVVGLVVIALIVRGVGVIKDINGVGSRKVEDNCLIAERGIVIGVIERAADVINLELFAAINKAYMNGIIDCSVWNF